MIASPVRYSILCALVLGGLALLATQGARLGLLPALLLLPLAAWPAWIALAYPATVRRIEARTSLRDGESPWWAPLLGGALSKQVAAVPVALLAAWSLCGSLIADAQATLACAAATAAVIYAAGMLIIPRAAPLKPYARLRPVLLAAPAIAALLLTPAWILTTGLNATAEGTMAESIAEAPRYEGPSMLLTWVTDGRGLIEGAGVGISIWAERQGAGPLVVLWRIVRGFGQFWFMALVFAGLLLPRGAARRILRPSGSDDPPPVGPRRAALAGFTATILLLFAVSSIARLEALAMQRQHPEVITQAPALPAPAVGAVPPILASGRDVFPASAPPGLPSPTDLRHAIEAERLGDLACPEGTIAGLRKVDDELRMIFAAQRATLESAARQGFAVMRANVTNYLDWYYSLPAEYARTGHLLVGDAELYLEERFRTHLEIGEPLAPLVAAAEALKGNPALVEEWRRGREALLGACGDLILPSDRGLVVTTATAPEALLLAGPSVEALDLRSRIGGASAAGAAGGLVGMAVGKLVAKESFGLAVEALGKLALGKAAGWLGGASAGAGGGALVGSIVPGVGTTIGAAVGSVVGGVSAWIATDALLLALEEAVSREGFEAEILLAIHEAEAEFLASLEASP